MRPTKLNIFEMTPTQIVADKKFWGQMKMLNSDQTTFQSSFAHSARSSGLYPVPTKN